MKVAYYTSAFFMDIMLEVIQGIKSKVELYVFIEISENSKNATLLNIPSLDKFNFIEEAEKVIGNDQWNYFKPYFKDVKSVKFIVYKNKKSFSFISLYKGYCFGNYLKKNQIVLFHFDNVSQRSLGLYFYLRKINVCISIHDSQSHKGEENWRDTLVNKLFFKLSKSFIFYSNYSKKQFSDIYPEIKAPQYSITLVPYTFIRNYLKKKNDETILFFGRLSYYKGIDILLKSIPKVLEKFPTQKFVIAGANQYDFKFDQFFKHFDNNVLLIEKYLTIKEIAELISKCKFIVCPYREATQSGVLMTAFASEKLVLASDVGSFSEYIINNKNGILVTPDATSISNAIITLLENDNYLNIIPIYSNKDHIENLEIIGNKLSTVYNKIYANT